MAGVAGVRVLRGPDWPDGEADGGEGHLGTLTQLLGDGRVQVVWDNGRESTCRAGQDGLFDLRVFDTAQAGIRHPATRCCGCGEVNVFGMLWRCQDCAGCDLCPLCYSDDKHDIRHKFLRFDHYKSEGQPVKKRKVSVRMRSMGAFPGATVTRGRDWFWADQDGGPGSEGEVKAFENVAPDSSRNLVHVQWSRGFSNSYRLGFNGNVDLTCVEEEVGPFYYRDHLPLLDSEHLPYPLAPTLSPTATSAPPPATATATPTPSPTSTTTTTTTTSSTHTGIATRSSTSNRSDDGYTPSLPTSRTSPPTPPVLSQARSQDDGAVGGTGVTGEATAAAERMEELLPLAAGDRVVVGVKENRLRDLQEAYGGVSTSMMKKLGQKGTVTEVTSGVMVRFTSMAYRFNPMALVKVTSLKEGDVVRIRRDVEQLKFLNKHIAWNQQIAETAGLAGRVVTVDRDDTVTVTFGHYQTFRFCPASCVPAPGATVDAVGVVGAALGARRAVGAVGAPARSTPDPARAATASAGSGGGGGGDVDVPVARNDGDDKGDAKGKQNTDDDSNSDMQNAVLRMMGLMTGSGSGSDPQVKFLFSAISKGEHLAVKTLLQTNMSLLTKTHQTLTPLMYACHKGQREIVTTMLDMGADVNARNEKQRSALLVALDSKQEEVALQLVGRGADPGVQNYRQRSALHEAAYEDLPNALQVLLQHGADVNVKDFAQDTPLFDAIEKDNHAIVQILLRVPALNAWELNAKGFNMLQIAALKGHSRCTEVILASENRPHVDELMLGEYSALHIAANNDHVEDVGILVLLGGATIDIGDGRRQLTPLHLACKRRMFKSAEALIGLGATVNVTDAQGNTPLHLAMGKSLEGDRDDSDVSRDVAIEGRTRVACLLLSSGAIADAEDDEGRSPLAYGHREVQDNVRRFLGQSEKDSSLPGVTDGKTSPASPSVGVPKGKTISEEEIVVSKQHDPKLLSSLLQGVSLQCARCDAMSDVTLRPCGHKSVCRRCCDVIARCPLCDGDIEEREPDNTDEQAHEEPEAEKEEEEEMNKFD